LDELPFLLTQGEEHMSQLTYKQLAPILDRLVTQGVLYHANKELMKQHMLTTLQELLGHFDEGCWERGCICVDDFAPKENT
jgi:hypothetical protein